MQTQSKSKFHVVIVGAGEVGVTTALLMCKMAEEGLIPGQFQITLLESESDILQGASRAVNIHHETGFEYLKAGHVRTGIDCVLGALTKRLCFDLRPMETHVPVRFLMSTDTIERGIATFAEFKANVDYMRTIYLEARDAIASRRRWSEAEADRLLGNKSQTFGLEVPANETAELSRIAGGFYSPGGGVDIDYDSALKKSALDHYSRNGYVRLACDQAVDSITKTNNGYAVRGPGLELIADLLLFTSAHNNPYLSSLVTGSRSGHPGIYHLNAMLYLKIKPIADRELRARVSKVNFILQGEGGCMYACRRPPTATQAGVAAVYFPSENGSQIEKHDRPPEHWQAWVRHGLPDALRTARETRILQQLFRFHPFLEPYVEPTNMLVRTVFNPVVPDNPSGHDRRVREIVDPAPICPDGKVLAVTSPKWTNVELTALSTIDIIVQRLGGAGLKKSDTGWGPRKLDIEEITRTANFRQAEVSNA